MVSSIMNNVNWFKLFVWVATAAFGLGGWWLVLALIQWGL